MLLGGEEDWTFYLPITASTFARSQENAFTFTMERHGDRHRFRAVEVRGNDGGFTARRGIYSIGKSELGLLLESDDTEGIGAFGVSI